MTAVRALKEEITKIGYSTVIDDYTFSDVFAASSINRKASVAAFTHTPPSYRNAALGVVHAEGGELAETVSKYRALGAPVLFVVKGDGITVWQVRPGVGSHQFDSVNQDQLAKLFSEHRETWAPLSIQRAKSIGQFRPEYQLDFVDLALLPAIEGELHTKLDRLLHEALTEAIDLKTGRTLNVKEQPLFRAVFRFLAAKILQDRSHPLSLTWNTDRIETILDAISNYYTLPPLHVSPRTTEYQVFHSVWQRIRRGINFQNISADDLAFVYENTLVTSEIRKRFGTHSTPRQVAEYVVCHLDLHKYAPEQLRVYEPFAGAAVFLVSALRHLRERLPPEWTDAQRHEFLVPRIAGDEIDAFAREVAMLSLILADYPMRNGWNVRAINLFQNGMLDAQMRAHNVILCNPPFEAFADSDRKRSIAHNISSQAIAVLNSALNAHPLALGFVLPRPFIVEKQFSEQRRRIERLYGAVELVQVPDRMFRFSKAESALLIARDPRPPAPQLIKLRSTEIADRDRIKFLRTGETTTGRELVRPIGNTTSGDLWIPPLQGLWEYLKSNPKLGHGMTIHRGLEWNYPQKQAWSETREPGYRRGLHSGRKSQQFITGRPVWLDCREESLRGGAIQWPWRKPKLIANAIRLSRGPWRVAASFDESGLVCSQQFFGLWPRSTMTDREMLALTAILNGPVANAFLAVRSPQKGIRITASLTEIPIPKLFPNRLSALVAEYCRTVTDHFELGDRPNLQHLLELIDATVLEAYDLPPKIERELLEFFRGAERPVAHAWKHWLPEGFRPFIPLSEYFSVEYRKATQPWIQEVIKPLPPEEAAALREYLD